MFCPWNCPEIPRNCRPWQTKSQPTVGQLDPTPILVSRLTAFERAPFSTAAESRKIRHMNFRVEIEQEEDGRWIAEVVDLPGVLAYGSTSEEAQAKVQALALRVLADRLEHAKLVLTL